jgi:aminoglycoside phosphotransferase (APT) family kinase protein
MAATLVQTLSDPRLPALEAVLDPRELLRHLSRALPAQWGAPRDVQIEVLQHHRASRCTVALKLQTTTGKHELIGKVYAKDRSDVYRAMEQISQSGFGAEKQLSIPQPIAFIPELHLLLQEKIEGPLVTRIFVTGNEHDRIEAAERCARWLAHFHSHGPISGPHFLLTHPLMDYWTHRLAKRAGTQAGEVMDKANALSEELKKASVRIDQVGLHACHGTYCHYQIILTETRTLALDWDGFCLAHPSLDLARFIIVLQQLALKSEGSLRAFDAANKAFCQTYAAEGGSDLTRHLAFYKAAHCLKHAKHHLKPGNGGVEMAHTMLDEGLRILAEEV